MTIPPDEMISDRIGIAGILKLGLTIIAVAVGILILISFVFPGLLRLRGASRNETCLNHMRIQSAAVLATTDRYGHYPASCSIPVPSTGPSQPVPPTGPSQPVPSTGPSQTFPSTGPSQTVPSTGPSQSVPWRVEIVPFIADEIQPQGKEVQQTKLSSFTKFFICPDDYEANIAHGYTSYMYSVGQNCVSDGTNSVTPDQITKGLAFTLLTTEVIHSQTVWQELGDLPLPRFQQGVNLDDRQLCAGSRHAQRNIRTVNISFCDGHVQTINTAIAPELWQTLPIVGDKLEFSGKNGEITAVFSLFLPCNRVHCIR